jgi:alkanesulfonate monooxygenase SsuD/methylene tetrahydromethanopterin reductase-like flavin-dependent oxidoreductase (luciferase family)
MFFGIYGANAETFADPQVAAEVAREAEEAGWAGFFLSDNLLFERVVPVADTWLTLAAVAAQTERIRLGPLVTALPRRHLGRLAREAVTLDRLSQGRLVLGVGSGDDRWGEYSAFGAPPPQAQLGAMLDEGLAVLQGLWSGQPFRFDGTYYHIGPVQLLPAPMQQPGIPIWVAGRWPHKGPFRRAAAWNGVFPNAIDGEPTPDDYRAIRTFLVEHGADLAHFAVVHTHETVPLAHPADEMLRAYAAAGVTWWLVSFPDNTPVAALREYIRRDPPRWPASATQPQIKGGTQP